MRQLVRATRGDLTAQPATDEMCQSLSIQLEQMKANRPWLNLNALGQKLLLNVGCTRWFARVLQRFEYRQPDFLTFFDHSRTSKPGFVAD